MLQNTLSALCVLSISCYAPASLAAGVLQVVMDQELQTARQ